MTKSKTTYKMNWLDKIWNKYIDWQIKIARKPVEYAFLLGLKMSFLLNPFRKTINFFKQYSGKYEILISGFFDAMSIGTLLAILLSLFMFFPLKNGLGLVILISFIHTLIIMFYQLSERIKFLKK